MKQKNRRLGRFLGWLSGSIRRKLTLFVVLVCLLLVGLVWLLLVQLLEPMYHYSIRRDLEGTANAVLAVAEEAEKKELLYLEFYGFNGATAYYYSEEFLGLLDEALLKGHLNLSERSVDLADENLVCRFQYDTISDSILHPVTKGGLFQTDSKDINSELVITLRAITQQNGSCYYVLETGQMVVGKRSANAQHTVLVSANLERIGQATGVLRALLIPVSALLVLVGVLLAWGFSRWFTKPIQQLSGAAQQMAKGNYDITIEPTGHDEIATLATDFNIMASEVKRSAAMQRDLIANVSHDLRTPLTLIKGYAETVRDLTGDNKQKRDEQLDVIVDETDRLSRLVGSVMELSRVSSGNEKPQPVRFDLSQLCEEVAWRYAEYGGQNGLDFRFLTDGESPVYADPALLERVLHNLLGNALNHVGPDGFVGLAVRHSAPGRVRVEVADHGKGIPAEDLPHIFDKYYRSRADSGKPGTGLGLSITKAILLAHNMDYGVTSEPDKGSLFWFEAPLSPQ